MGIYSQLADTQLRLFVFFKRSNLLLIAVGFLILVYQCIVFPKEFYWFVFLFAFAIIEHVNYYHIRLSYMSVEEIREFIQQKGFRSSLLAKELKKRNKQR